MHGLKEYSWLIDRIRKYNVGLGIENLWHTKWSRIKLFPESC